MLRLLYVWNRIRGDSLTMSVIVGAWLTVRGIFPNTGPGETRLPITPGLGSVRG
jgi:hypothetical protein